MILLNEEEMDREYCLADLHTDKFAHKAIAKAQAKKMAEWVERNLTYIAIQLDGSDILKLQDNGKESAEKWQALLKEIEDEM